MKKRKYSTQDALSIVRPFMPKSQMTYIEELINSKSEDIEYVFEVIDRLADINDHMPATYEQDCLGDNAIILNCLTNPDCQ